ncbi:hypothetical protein [Comamonas sp. B21-038]|uniref:hypothetical protein n=1 Tax=Comamonas sp. B21-038 TaxID=2918299 RepID=UPI001EFA6B19|nr:hypothetical protein [Comamonas sp. B21-038]ULR87443.1 hypothetical protein MJ205_13315 [Comamonas sp. B21-038]
MAENNSSAPLKTAEGMALGDLSQRVILDAIRSAYDTGYNDSRLAKSVPGDSAPGYEGRNIEADHGGALIARLNQLLAAPQAQPAFQQRVQPWMMECFGAEIAADRIERNHRFLEEALELVQATGCTQSEAHQLVDYVFGRPVGEPAQEVGGVMVTLAALCLANGLDMHQAGETELARVWTKVEAIRAKQAAKPKHSPLPQAQAQPADALDASRFAWLAKSSWYVGPSSFYADEAGGLQDYDDMNLSPKELRASIDAAMAAAQEGGNAAAGKDGAA